MSKLSVKRSEISKVLGDAMSQSCSGVKSARLEAFSNICEELVKKSVPLKISLVVRYMNEAGYKMSSQSVYNKQDGGNPYRTLFDLWDEYDRLKRSSLKPKVNLSSSFDDYIDEEDIKLIDDTALRYRISLMYGELKGLKKQNDLLKQVKEMNVVQSVPEHLLDSTSSSKIILDMYEIDILKEFVESKSLVGFSDDGALVAKRLIKNGTSLSNPGLREALLKVLNSYMVN